MLKVSVDTGGDGVCGIPTDAVRVHLELLRGSVVCGPIVPTHATQGIQHQPRDGPFPRAFACSQLSSSRGHRAPPPRPGRNDECSLFSRDECIHPAPPGLGSLSCILIALPALMGAPGSDCPDCPGGIPLPADAWLPRRLAVLMCVSAASRRAAAVTTPAIPTQRGKQPATSDLVGMLKVPVDTGGEGVCGIGLNTLIESPPIVDAPGCGCISCVPSSAVP
ncbi:hypothetical protein GGR56DRAFT_507062 [Xylariaceae sp. FL0804]|nr:hypothetical protein GGR56DRAFT_507062 [Xylariaceae sp. FL0804]